MEKTLKTQKRLFKILFFTGIGIFVLALVFGTDYNDMFLEGNAQTALFYKGTLTEDGRIVVQNDLMLILSIVVIVLSVLAKLFFVDKYAQGIITLVISIISGIGVIALTIVSLLNLIILKKDYLALEVTKIVKFSTAQNENPEYLIESTWAMNLGIVMYILLLVVVLATVGICIYNYVLDNGGEEDEKSTNVNL